MDSIKRRNFLKNAALGSVATVIATSTQAKMVTPSEVEGPFYPITPQKDKDADLTKVDGKDGVAKGEIIVISGQVFDQHGNVVEDVTIDLWQANSFGRYHHPHDNSDAPIDENFQSWAILQSGKQGRFKFKTVMPGAYPLGASQQRTPHIHVKVGKLGYESLLTQMYFPNHPLNEKDGLFKRKSKEEQKMMTAKKLSKDGNQYRFNFVIERV
ncbi:MAG: protocatechuate 3,4-dioxygenase [Kangiellaceae bacterium]|nr:protocatechuate 3,4-dioxygenase [Kangiellaceae bacterium]MCW8997258.1 protocatechuate 3,4-dioxygenase [Kangiellaceae bacterium]